jgi:hypothetical protein
MFKIGDRVRRLEDEYCGMNPGDIGTIVGFNDVGDISILEYGGIKKRHSAWKFELVKEKPKKVIKRFGISDFVDGLNKK